MATSGQLQGAKEDTEFSFMVQEPKEIMDVSSARSFLGFRPYKGPINIYRLLRSRWKPMLFRWPHLLTFTKRHG